MKIKSLLGICLAFAALSTARAIPVNYNFVSLSGEPANGVWSIGQESFEEGTWKYGRLDSPIQIAFADLDFNDIFSAAFTLTDDRVLLLPGPYWLRDMFQVWFDTDESGLVSWHGGIRIADQPQYSGTGIWLRDGEAIPASIPVPDGGSTVPLLGFAVGAMLLARKGKP